MKQVCAWCEREGKTGLLGEKEPLDDPSETHGVCDSHQRVLLATLRARGALTAPPQT
jgi:hypothetical protein